MPRLGRDQLDRLCRVAVPILATVTTICIALTLLAMFRRHLIQYESPTFGAMTIENRMGGIRTAYTNCPAQRMDCRFASLEPMPVLSAMRSGQFLGFSYRRSSQPAGAGTMTSSWTITVPHWFGIATSCGLMIWPIMRSRRMRKAVLAGCCVKCGYDLRASPDRCPECGEVRPSQLGDMDERRIGAKT